MHHETDNLWRSVRLEIFNNSGQSAPTLREITVNLTQTVDAMSRRISDLFDRASRVRVIARDSNRAFVQMQERLLEYKTALDKRIPTADIVKTKVCHLSHLRTMLSEQKDAPQKQTMQIIDVPSKDQKEEIPQIQDFQEAIQSLSRLQQLTDDWISTYDTGFPTPRVSNSASLIKYDFDIVLGDKQHPKHLLSTIKQIQWRVYKLVPLWARGIIFPKEKDSRNLTEDDDLEGLKGLDLHIESDGLSGHYVLEDRDFVNGMECLRLCLEGNESRLMEDDHIEGAFALLEQTVKEDPDDVGGGRSTDFTDGRSLH